MLKYAVIIEAHINISALMNKKLFSISATPQAHMVLYLNEYIFGEELLSQLHA